MLLFLLELLPDELLLLLLLPHAATPPASSAAATAKVTICRPACSERSWFMIDLSPPAAIKPGHSLGSANVFHATALPGVSQAKRSDPHSNVESHALTLAVGLRL
jgi:hypothetical protein